LQVLRTVDTWVQQLSDPEDKAVAEPVLESAKQVEKQDVESSEEGKVSLIKGVAKDRRISVEDGQMRHGRKSRSVRVDGYKRHVLHDLDTGLIRAVGLTPANVPEGSVTAAISADLQEVSLQELHIDRAYLSSQRVARTQRRACDLLQSLASAPRQTVSQADLYPGLGTADHPLPG
jgi:Transposase DDE domain